MTQPTLVVNYDPIRELQRPAAFPRLDYVDLAARIGARVVDLRALGIVKGLDEALYRSCRVYPLLALRSLVAARQPEVMFLASEPVAASVMLVERMLRRTGTRHVVQTHHPLSRKFGRALDAGLFDRVSSILTLSQHELAHVQKRRPALAGALAVSRLSVDTEFYAPQPADDGHAYVAAIGSSWRDYETLVAAARLVPRIPVHLKVGSSWVATSRRFQASGLPPNLTVSGFVPPIELRRFIARSAAVVVPLLPGSQVSAGCTTTTIAQALGKSPIATALPGIAGDYVRDRETGLLVEPRDPRALSDAIAFAWGDARAVRAMGSRGRQFVEQELSLEIWLRRMIGLLGTAPPRHLPSATA